MLEASSPTGFSHLPSSGLVGSLSTVLMLSAGEHPRGVPGCWVFLTGSVPLEEMDLVQTGPSGDRSRGWGPWGRGQLREKWPGEVLFVSDPSQLAQHPDLAPGQEVVPSSLPRPAQAPMELPMAARSLWLPPPRPAHSCFPHMNPTRGFGHGVCRRGSAKAPKWWVFLPMAILWTLAPLTYDSGWPHSTMELA